MSWNQYVVSRRCQLIIDGASPQKIALRNLHMIVFLFFSREICSHFLEVYIPIISLWVCMQPKVQIWSRFTFENTCVLLLFCFNHFSFLPTGVRCDFLGQVALFQRDEIQSNVLNYRTPWFCLIFLFFVGGWGLGWFMHMCTPEGKLTLLYICLCRSLRSVLWEWKGMSLDVR